MAIIGRGMRIGVVVGLIIFSFTLGEESGYNKGVSEMGAVAGPALYRCVELLGGTFGRVK